MIAQLYWLRLLYKVPPSGYQPLRGAGAARSGVGEVAKEQAEDEAAEAALQYVPI